MRFKIGERARIVSASLHPILLGQECIVWGYGLDEANKYLIEIKGFPPPVGKKSWSAPDFALEKLKPAGWEKTSWDSMPWKPKELVS